MIDRYFSYSGILTYATCPMKYFWNYRRKITPVEKAQALSFGYCMSEGLKGYRTEGTLEAAKRDLKARNIFKSG